MSTTEAVPKIAAVKPSKPAAKENKAPATKPKSAKNVSHPPYFEMIKDAILALKEKGGSSPYAIGKYIEEKQKAALPANFRKILGQQLKNSAAKGKLIKVKASYKLSDTVKKEKKAPKAAVAKKKGEKAKKTAATAAATAVATAAATAVATATAAAKPVKKSEAVKKTKKPAKAKAKQPKSIKSPMKKAKKAVA